MQANVRSLLSDWGRSNTGVALLFCLLVTFAGIYVVVQYSAFLLNLLPYALILLCPLMHLFMHHGHPTHNQAQDAMQSNSSRSTHDEHAKGGNTETGGTR